MRNSPVLTVDATAMPEPERERIQGSVEEAKASGKLDLSALPDDVRAQVLFALDSVARGQQVAAVASGKALTSTEASELLGMSRTHLTRLCNEGRIPSFKVGTSLRIEADIVMTILRERGRVRTEAQEAVSSSEDRRRARALRAAGLE